MAALFSKRPFRVTIEITEISDDTVLAEITTSDGVIRVLCEVSFVGNEMHVTNAHVEGLSRGALGREGLNNIAEAIRRKYHVDSIFIEGATRTTGANPGRKPKPIRFPRGPRP